MAPTDRCCGSGRMARSDAEAARPARAGAVRIGISGWRYGPWRGVFYPGDLPQRRELEFAARAFPTIEINGTFYSLQRPESFARWAEAAPEGFVFSVKAPRFITHIKRLKNIDAPLANFFASGVLRLGAKLGPILWQFPPNFRFDADLLDAFFRLLPRDTAEAAALARRHDVRLKGRAWLTFDRRRKLRHAIEIRHESFVVPAFVALLRRHDIALVCADTPDYPRLMDLTADFAYCRLHGAEELYASGYGDHALREWAKRVAAWARGRELAGDKRASDRAARRRARRDVYVYFDNDKKVCAPRDAKSLIARVDRLLGVRRPRTSALG